MEPLRPRIAVYGSSTVREGEPDYRLAHALGGELARAGADVVTGGYGGVMEACSRGAFEAGGRAIGVTVELFETRGPVNRWVSERVHTPDLFERLRVLVSRADGFVAMAGSVGTLTEFFLTWTLLSANARPRASLVLLGEPWAAVIGAHRDAGFIPNQLFRHLQFARDPAEAARLAVPGHAAMPRT